MIIKHNILYHRFADSLSDIIKHDTVTLTTNSSGEVTFSTITAKPNNSYIVSVVVNDGYSVLIRKRNGNTYWGADVIDPSSLTHEGNTQFEFTILWIQK